MNKNEFIDYVLSFYGPGEIYDMGATREDVLEALVTRLLSKRYSSVPFDGDSIDREMIRDIMIEAKEGVYHV